MVNGRRFSAAFCLALLSAFGLPAAAAEAAEAAEAVGKRPAGGARGSRISDAAGVVRAARFWGGALPIYMDYRRMQRDLQRDGNLSEADRARYWTRAHEKYAPRVLKLLVDLRGFYVKIGQVASSVPDMFPGPYIDQMRQLQGEHPDLLARPISEVQAIIRGDLGERIELIEAMEASALGAAATGQVHRARLRDGREVVVKVQYPEAEKLFRQDFANTRLWCQLLMPEYLPYIHEAQKSFMSEFDFRREAADLDSISRSFEDTRRNHFAAHVRIPHPVMELSSRNVVVMEYLPGETLLTYALRRKGELENASCVVALWQGWFLRRHMRQYLELLVNVQGHQIFVDGVFNGDPHPGNILLMPDGRLGLIDYGNVNRLSVMMRAKLGRLILALASEDKSAIVAAAVGMGYRSERNDPEVLFRYVRLAFDRDDPESLVLPDGTVCGNIQIFAERLDKLDKITNVPPGLVMAARNSILLRGLAVHLGMRLHMAKAWSAAAEQAVQAVEPAQLVRLRRPSYQPGTLTAFRGFAFAFALLLAVAAFRRLRRRRPSARRGASCSV